MSTPSASGTPTSTAAARRRPWWLRWLLRRSDANAGGPANPDLRLIETAILIVAGLVLAVATANDIGRSVHITERLKIDAHTYRYYMHTQGHVTKSIRKVPVTPAIYSKVDVACSPPPGGPRASTCLVIGGAVHASPSGQVRDVIGGYRLLPGSRNRYAARYACFGVSAAQQLCGASGPKP